jgi:hypothetical protein
LVITRRNGLNSKELTRHLGKIIEKELTHCTENDENWESSWEVEFQELVAALERLRKPMSQLVPDGWCPDTGRFILYTHVGRDGGALYIGKTRCFKARQKAHQTSSKWWNKIDYMEFDEFDTQQELDAAELRAIHRYQPEHNIVDNPRYGR